MRLITTFLYMAPAGRPARRAPAPRPRRPGGAARRPGWRCRSPARRGIWSERWRAPDERLRGVESALRRSGGVVFSRRRLRALGPARARRHAGLDAHADGRRGARRRPAAAAHPLLAALLAHRRRRRARLRPRWRRAPRSTGAWVVAAVLAAVVAVIVTCVVKDCATAAGVLTHRARRPRRSEAQREFEPVARRARSRVPRTGTGPTRRPSTAARDDATAPASCRARACTFAAPLQMAERRIELPRGRQVRIAGRAVPHHPERFRVHGRRAPDGRAGRRLGPVEGRAPDPAVHARLPEAARRSRSS